MLTEQLAEQAKAIVIESNTEQWQTAIDVMHRYIAEMIENLSNMADFNLFKLEPENGLLVKDLLKDLLKPLKWVRAGDQIDFIHLDQSHQTIEKEEK